MTSPKPHTQFVLQLHDAERGVAITLRDANTAEFMGPTGPATVSGPSTRHALMRAVDLALGATSPAGGFSFVPLGRPGPSQWRALYAAAEELLRRPGAEAQEKLAAAVAATGVIDPIAEAPVPEGAPASAELLKAAEELASLITRDTLWKAALGYCRALAASFDPTAATSQAKQWDAAKLLATRLADLVATARKAGKPAPKR